MKIVTLRNIPKDVVKGINAYKKEVGVKNTTDAIYGIVSDHLPMQKRITKLKVKLMMFETEYLLQCDRLEYYFQDLSHAETMKQDIIKALKERKS